jgi:hypothetical protein
LGKDKKSRQSDGLSANLISENDSAVAVLEVGSRQEAQIIKKNSD